MSFTLDKIVNPEDIKDNSVFIVNFHNEGYDSFSKIAKMIQDTFIESKNCKVFFIHESQSLDVFPECEMNKLGWFKNKI